MKNIKKGTCILSEKPFVYVLKSKYRQQRCDHCLELKDDLKKCSSCCYVYYCDRVCQVEAWKIHKTECQYLKKIIPRTVPDAARVISRIIIKLNNGGDLEKGYYTEGNYRKFRDLMSHYQEIKADAKRMEHFETLEIVLHDLLGDILVPNSTELLGIYGKLVTNGFNILDQDMNPIGTGIYLGVSVTDHSCLPNAVVTFHGTILKLRVLEDMPCLDWSKIFISYVDLLNTSEQRRNELKDNYYFVCDCSKCNDSNETMQMNAAACPNTNCNEFIDVKAHNTCPKCKIAINNDFKLKFSEVLEYTKEHIFNMKETAFLDVCQLCLQMQRKIIHPMNIFHVKTLDLAFESAIDMKKWPEAMKFGQELIDGFRVYYGELNPLLGLLYLKLGKIQLYEGQSKLSLKTLKESLKILEITHGHDDPMFRNHLVPLMIQASTEIESNGK